MKPPRQHRPSNRASGPNEPRPPRPSGDEQERGQRGGPRQPGRFHHHHAGAETAPAPPRGGGGFQEPHRRDSQPSRPDRPHPSQPARSQRLHIAPDEKGESGSRRGDSHFPPRQSDHRPNEFRRDADSPRGTVWLHGLHAVAAALSNPMRRLRRLLLTEEAEAALIVRCQPPWPVAHERVDRGRLDQLLGRTTVHQGMALLADLLVPPPLALVLERPGPLIVLDQVSDPRNVGAILRSARAFGAAAVIVQERNAPEETGTLAKAASGALETVPLLRAVNLARTLVALKASGCWVVGLDSSGKSLVGSALAERRVALVLGSEGEGLRRLTRDTCDEVAGIAMPGAGGGLDSLNVSAAAAVALYELGRRI